MPHPGEKHMSRVSQELFEEWAEGALAPHFLVTLKKIGKVGKFISQCIVSGLTSIWFSPVTSNFYMDQTKME